jgi:hypothetical protein
VKYALGAKVRHAKFAARLIGHMKDDELALNVVNVCLRSASTDWTVDFGLLDNQQGATYC